MAIAQKISDKIGLSLFQIFSIVLVSVGIAWTTLSYQWLILFMGLIGIGFFAFVFGEPLKALLLWMIASPILDFYLRIPLGKGIPDITFTRATVVMIFFVIVLQVILNMRDILPRQKTETYLIIFSAIALASMALRPNLSQNLQVFIDGYMTPFAFFFLAKNLISNKKDVRLFFYALGIAGFYLAVIGIIQYFTHINPFVPDTLVITHAKRAHGPFANAVEYGGVMAIAFLGSFYLFTELTGFRKIPVMITMALTAAATFLSLTRAVWLSLIAGLCIIVYYLPKYRRMMAFCAGLAVVMVIAIGLFFANSTLLKKRTGEVGPIYSRIALYATAINTSISKPVLGYGFGQNSFYDASRDHLVTFSFIADHFGLDLTVPHNEFLHILVMLGIVGLTIYLGIFYSSLKKSRQLYKISIRTGSYNKKNIVFYWAILATFIINGFFVDMLWFSYFNALVFLVMGMMEGSGANLNRSSVRKADATLNAGEASEKPHNNDLHK